MPVIPVVDKNMDQHKVALVDLDMGQHIVALVDMGQHMVTLVDMGQRRVLSVDKDQHMARRVVIDMDFDLFQSVPTVSVLDMLVG